MLIQFEQKPWKLVVVGKQEGKTEGAKGTLTGGEGENRKAAVTATGLLLLQLEGQDVGKNTLKRYFIPFPLVLAF